MNAKKTIPAIIALLMLGAVAAHAEPQTQCPVMGGKVNKQLFVDVNGKRIYVCCGGCIKAIKADPDKYIKQMEAAGIELEKTPAAKPEPKNKAN